MHRVTIGTLLLGVIISTSAASQEWSAVDANGLVIASVISGDTSISVRCAPPGGETYNAVTLSFGEVSIAGPVTFAFDGDTTVAGLFADGQMIVDSPQNEAIFALLRDALKSRNEVTVTARNAQPIRFSLSGSNRAIGDCALATRGTVIAPRARPNSVAVVEAVTPPGQQADASRLTALRPISGDPFVDYRLTACDGIRGLLLMTYDTLNGVTEMSDFCLDEATGVVSSSEPRSGFVPVENDTTGRAFEIPESGTNRYTRVRIALADDLGCAGKINANSVTYAIPDGQLARNADSLFLYARGVTVPDASLIPRPLFNSDQTLLSIRDFSVRRVQPATTETSLLPAGADLRGILSASGAFEVTGGNGVWVGDADGELALTVEDTGDVIGGGQFIAQNQWGADDEASDWVTITAKIPYMRGYVLGENGSLVIAYGTVRGSYVDASDQTHDFEASATFTACRP